MVWTTIIYFECKTKQMTIIIIIVIVLSFIIIILIGWWLCHAHAFNSLLCPWQKYKFAINRNAKAFSLLLHFNFQFSNWILFDRKPYIRFDHSINTIMKALCGCFFSSCMQCIALWRSFCQLYFVCYCWLWNSELFTIRFALKPRNIFFFLNIFQTNLRSNNDKRLEYFHYFH